VREIFTPFQALEDAGLQFIGFLAAFHLASALLSNFQNLVDHLNDLI
jgi:hypothetical protein